MNEIRYIKEKKINYIIIFLLIYLSSSFHGLSIKGSVNTAILLIISIITFIFNSNSKHINPKSFILILLIIILSMLTMLINSENPYNYIIFWAHLIGAYVIYISIELEEFIAKYNQIMFFLAIFSLITYGLLLLFPNIYSYFPAVTNKAGFTAYNLFFSVVRYSNYMNRNFGLFWEPGAYQTFLNLALFFELYVTKSINKKRIFVFLLTIITTFSTTGYLASLFLIFIYVFIDKRNILISVENQRKKIIVSMIILLVISTIVFVNLPTSFKFNVFGKLEAIFKPELLNSNTSYRSTSTRVNSIIIPIINFIKSPVWGVGFDNLYKSAINLGTNFLTATPINWFGLFGFPLGILLNLCLLKWVNKIKVEEQILLKIFICAFLMLIIISENYNRNAFFLSILFYGFDGRAKHIEY